MAKAPPINIKLPASFAAAYRGAIDDLGTEPGARAEVVLPDGTAVLLEVASVKRGLVVRPATPRSAIMIRRFANDQDGSET